MTSLPSVLVLTDRHLAADAGRTLPETAALLQAIEGLALVVREKDLPIEERGEILAAIGEVAPDLPIILSTGAVVRHDEFRVGHGMDVAGYHTASGFMLTAGSVAWRGLGGASGRRPKRWVGKSCHTGDDLRYAIDGEADYVTISPVYESSSKPGYGPALGPAGLADLVRELQAIAADQATVAPAVYALGGINADRVGECAEAGAHGVAVMGAVMSAADPGGIALALVEACSLEDT